MLKLVLMVLAFGVLADASPWEFRFREFNITEYRPENRHAVMKLYEDGIKQNFYNQGRDVTKLMQVAIPISMRNDFLKMDEVYHLKKTEQAKKAHFWVVKDKSGDVVASIGVSPSSDPSTSLLRRLSVSPQAQRRGLGKRLVQLVEDWSAAHGYTMVSLDTNRVFAAARSLYLKLGYTMYDAHCQQLQQDCGHFHIVRVDQGLHSVATFPDDDHHNCDLYFHKHLAQIEGENGGQ